MTHERKVSTSTGVLGARRSEIGSREFSSELTKDLHQSFETWNVQTIGTWTRSSPVLQQKLGITAINETISMDAHKTSVDLEIVFSVVDESRHPLFSGFLDEFGNLQKHRIREYFDYSIF